MATFTFTVASSPTIDVDQVGPDVVRIQLPSQVVVDEAYRSLDTYDITVVSGTGDVSIRSIIAPTADIRVTDEVLLYIDLPEEGTVYEISIDALRRRDGIGIITTGRFQARRTKTESMLRDIPSHWDKRPSSMLHNVLVAIAIEDDKIGGSRDDRL